MPGMAEGTAIGAPPTGLPFPALGPVGFDSPWWFGGMAEIPLDPMGDWGDGIDGTVALVPDVSGTEGFAHASYGGDLAGRSTLGTGFQPAALMARGDLGATAALGGRFGREDGFDNGSTDAPATSGIGGESAAPGREAPQPVDSSGAPPHLSAPGPVARAAPTMAAVAGPEVFLIPSDGLFASQWHLLNTGQGGGQAGIDINVTGVWDDYTGAGVVVGVVDDGVQYTHPDLDGNYDTALDYDYGGNDSDAAPGASDYHGTAVGGLIAAERDGTGTVGVAYDATITGFRIFGGTVTNAELADAFLSHVGLDASNNSWGYGGYLYDDFDSPAFSGVGAAIDTAVTAGRDGLGNVILFAAGNSRLEGQDANYHSFQNVRETITVAAIDDTGKISYYSTPGAPILVGSPSNGGVAGITTTDRTGTTGYASGDYTSTFGGTSAATPIATGVVALMLEANADLGYRDVQEILAYSARMVDQGDPGWAWNGAGNWNGGALHTSHDFDFGLIDALAAVRLAETWDQQGTRANEYSLSASSSPNTFFTGAITDSVTLDAGMNVDQVEVTLDIDHAWIGDLIIKLTSPDGTESVLLDRPGKGPSGSYWGTSQDDVKFTFSSTNHWGEMGEGTWTLSIDDAYTAADHGTLNAWTLSLYGDAAGADDLYVYTDEFADFADQTGGAEAGIATSADGGGEVVASTADIVAASAPDREFGVIEGQEYT